MQALHRPAIGLTLLAVQMLMALFLLGAAAPMAMAQSLAAQAQPAPPISPAQPAPAPAPADVPDDFPPLADGLAWPEVTATTAAADAATTSLNYTVEVKGLAPLGLQDEFQSLAGLWTHRGEATNQAQLARRITEARDLIDQLLRSVGHYGGDTRATLANQRGQIQVTLTVTPGPMYSFGAITVVPLADSSGPDPVRLVTARLGLRLGDPVDASRVAAASAALPNRLADAGFAFARTLAPDITIDHADHKAALVQAVDLGRRGAFGTIGISGSIQGFDARHLNLLARFKPGETYSNIAREDLRRALIQTGLFGAVAIKPEPGPVLEDGRQQVNLAISTEAAPVRTIGLGAGFSTGQGVRVEGSWTHRNLFPPEGAFTVRAVAAEREQVAQVEVKRRNFGQRDRSFTITGGFTASQQFAYAAETLGVTAGLTRESNTLWQKRWTWSLGGQLLATSQRDRSAPGGPRTLFYVAAAPASLTWDMSDDLLNPSRGFRLTTRISPEYAIRSGTNVGYVKAQLDGSVYQPLGPLVLAGRLHMGSITGADRASIAPDRRFYAGGGGSVRGYDFQGVGPRGLDGSPTGGNAITEASVEARYRFTAFGNDLGLVAFMDAGQVYENSLPNFNGLRLGAGLGVRYYTSFGPVRVDIATPLKRRAGEPVVAFYVSIGQAF